MIAIDTVQDIAMSKFSATVQSVLKQRGALKRIWSHRKPSCAATRTGNVSTVAAIYSNLR